MGKMWGNLSYIRNVVYVRVSPYEINPFANYFQKSLKGLKRDLGNNLPYVAPCLLATYLVITWANDYNDKLNRKQPGQFDHEV